MNETIFGFDYGIKCMFCNAKKRDYKERLDVGTCGNYFVNRTCNKCGRTWVLTMTKTNYKLMQRLEKKL